MMKLTVIICMVLYGFHYFSEQYKREQLARQEAEVSAPQVANTFYESPTAVEPAKVMQSTSGFKCDGRVHCSQMRSCEEATFFINSCPGTKMDGDHDGIPCEQQFC